MLAYLDWEALTCSGCGGYLPETTDADNDGRYVAGVPHRCYRCHAIEAQRAEYEKPDSGTKFPRALVVWPAELRRRE